jgi:hypothetical protein
VSTSITLPRPEIDPRDDTTKTSDTLQRYRVSRNTPRLLKCSARRLPRHPMGAA